MLLILLAALAIAQPSDPDGVVSTAPREGADAVAVGAVAPTADIVPDAVGSTVTTQDLTTAQQIERWIGARGTAADAPFAEDRGPGDDRRMHGFVSGSIGTNDFSNVTVGVSLPIGETGRLDMSYSQTRNGWLGYGYPGYGYGDGFYSPRIWQGFTPTAYEPFFADQIVTPGGRIYGSPAGQPREVKLHYSSNGD